MGMSNEGRIVMRSICFHEKLSPILRESYDKLDRAIRRLILRDPQMAEWMIDELRRKEAPEAKSETKEGPGA